MNKMRYILSSVCIALLLSACGGSGGSSSPSEPTSTKDTNKTKPNKDTEKEKEKEKGKEKEKEKKPIAVSKGDIVGKVVDGYIKGAQVFFDTNLNFTYDEKLDIESISDKEGSFKLKDAQKKLKDMGNLLVSLGGNDVDTDNEMKQILVASPMKNDGAKPIYITPLSTTITRIALLIHNRGGSYNNLTLADFEDRVLGIFGAPKDYLHINPLDNMDIYKLNLAIQKTIEITDSNYKEFVMNLSAESGNLRFLVENSNLDNKKEALKLIDYIYGLKSKELEEDAYRREEARKIQDNVDNKKVTLGKKNKKNEIDIVGRVVDGYLEGTFVFFDTNGNLKYDNKEISDTTDQYGRFMLKGIKKDDINMQNSLVAEGGSDVDTGRSLEETLLFSPTLEDVKGSIYITPISTTITAVARKLAFEGSYGGFSMGGGFKSQVLGILGTDDSGYNANPLEDNELYKVVQKIQKTLELNNWTYDDFAASLNSNQSSIRDVPGINQASKNFIDFMDGLSSEDLDKKRVNIAKEAQKQIDKDEFDANKINIKDLPNDDKSEDVEDFTPTPIDEEDTVMEGIFVFPYNVEATIFLDANRNGSWDEEEKRVKADKDGKFEIGLSSEEMSKRLPIVAIDGKNKAGQSEKYKSILFFTPMGKNTNITPLTTFHTSAALALMQGMMVEAGIQMTNFSEIAEKTLEIGPDEFGKDYTKLPDTLELYRKNLAINNLVKGLALSLENGKSFKEKFLFYYKILASNISGSRIGIDKLLDEMAKNNGISGNRLDALKEILSTCENAPKDEIENGTTQNKVDELLERIKNYKDVSNLKQPSADLLEYPDLPKDEFSKYQWHLLDQGAVVNTKNIATVGGHDLGVEGLYKRGILGKSARVRVVDDGYYAEHEDLKARLDMSNSYNSNTKQNDPTPGKKTDTHGTQVAGLIGADGSNGKGLRGVAPYVTMEAFKIKTLESGGLELSEADLRKAWLGGSDSVSIVNNSWGATAIERNPEDERILEEGSKMRGGLGRIYLIAAGNSGFNQGEENFVSDDAGTSYTRGSQYAIVVGSARNENIVTQYSSQGANVLVSSYGGGVKYATAALMATTAVPGTSKTTWKEDTQKQYTFGFNGTSAATPVASGALALVLDKCPTLSYRDVKWLIAHTAKKIDPNYDGLSIPAPNVPPYQTAPKLDMANGYGYIVNGAGLSHSNYYGYGLINPSGMIDICSSPSFQSLPPKKTNKFVQETTSLTDLGGGDLKEIILADKKAVDASKKINKVEWVGLTVYASFKELKKISIVLISPSGTVSRILTHSVTAPTELGEFEIGYRLSSVAFVDEDPYGEWKVLIHSDDESEDGRVTKLELEIVGHER